MQVIEEVQPAITADELYIKDVNGFPLFHASTTTALDVIENEGHDIYYVLASEQIETQEGTVKKSVYRPTIFRVTKTIIGRSIIKASSPELDIPLDIKQSAWFTLPKIPWTMLKKMDSFFRQAYKLHGTESVLVLTYDPNYKNSENPSDGWGCIAPKQTNTAASCDYEFDSVMQVKPEHVFIVGSAHSHPNMSAYFSGTDHQDQADWDGLHITFGWKGDGPSEYHIGLMLGGEEWPFKPEQVFEPAPEPTIALDEVDGWVQNVQKKVYTQPASATTTGGWVGATYNTPVTSYKPALGSSIPSERKRAIKLPDNTPDPRNHVIVARVDLHDNMKCCFCSTPLAPKILESRRCAACSSYFLIDDEPLDELLPVRQKLGKPYDINIDIERSPVPIVVWNVDPTGKNHFFSGDQRIAASPK
jgi:hypothetical protein